MITTALTSAARRSALPPLKKRPFNLNKSLNRLYIDPLNSKLNLSRKRVKKHINTDYNFKLKFQLIAPYPAALKRHMKKDRTYVNYMNQFNLPSIEKLRTLKDPLHILDAGSGSGKIMDELCLIQKKEDKFICVDNHKQNNN